MKLSRPATVFATVVILAGGAAAAVNATTGTDPVTLCSNAKTGAVTVPGSGGACAKGTMAFEVVSDAAVQALGARLGAAEAQLSAAETRLATAETELADQTAALQALDDDFRAFTPSTLEVDELVAVSPGIEWSVRLAGVGLKPGAEVRVRYTMGSMGISTGAVVGTVGSDGTVSRTVRMPCTGRNFAFSTQTDGDDPISTAVIPNGPGC